MGSILLEFSVTYLFSAERETSHSCHEASFSVILPFEQDPFLSSFHGAHEFSVVIG